MSLKAWQGFATGPFGAARAVHACQRVARNPARHCRICCRSLIMPGRRAARSIWHPAGIDGQSHRGGYRHRCFTRRPPVRCPAIIATVSRLVDLNRDAADPRRASQQRRISSPGNWNLAGSRAGIAHHALHTLSRRHRP
jgi:hypothetical protein